MKEPENYTRKKERYKPATSVVHLVIKTQWELGFTNSGAEVSGCLSHLECFTPLCPLIGSGNSGA